MAPRQKKNKKLLVQAADDRCFWVWNGPVLHNLCELRDFIGHKKLSKDQFAHHVAHEKNDLADWVDHVLSDQKCAAGLRKVKTERGTLGVLEKTLRDYE
ncbi:MAG: hypothetical protein AAB652_02340 [Patescibacteria group bacterium]